MNAHKIALRYLKEQVASVEKFHADLVAERATMGADTWTIDYMINAARRRKDELLEALSEAVVVAHSKDEPKNLIHTKPGN